MTNIIFLDSLIDDNLTEDFLLNRVKPVVESGYKEISDYTFSAEDSELLILGTYDKKEGVTHLTVERVTFLEAHADKRKLEEIKDLPDSELSFMEKKALEKAQKHTS